MLGIYLIDGMILQLANAAASRLLRLLGGPASLPQRNEDLVWY